MGAAMGKLGSCAGQKMPGCSKRGSDMRSLCQSPDEPGWFPMLYLEPVFSKTWGLPEEGKEERIKRKQGENDYETE